MTVSEDTLSRFVVEFPAERIPAAVIERAMRWLLIAIRTR